MTWQPRAWIEELKWLIEKIEKLPYKPSLRWCDYRVMDHFGMSKKSFGTFEKSIGNARKHRWGGWSQDTLTDSVRTVYYRGYGYHDFEGLVDSIINQQWLGHLWSKLPIYIEVWYEAEAMFGQFDYYLKDYRITMRPFKGDYSIPLKWKASQDILEMKGSGKDVIILYFGDCDEKGEAIPKSALRDIITWGDTFRFEQCGLTIEQAHNYNLPFNPKRPDQWQWEALDDGQAGEIILDALHSAINIDMLDETLRELAKTEEDWKNQLREKLGGASP